MKGIIVREDKPPISDIELHVTVDELHYIRASIGNTSTYDGNEKAGLKGRTIDGAALWEQFKSLEREL